MLKSPHQTNKYTKKVVSRISYGSLICLTVVNLLILVGSVFLWLRGRSYIEAALKYHGPPSQPILVSNTASAITPYPAAPTESLASLIIKSDHLPSDSSKSALETQTPPINLDCIDPLWCNVPIPTKSHYKFDTPIDPAKWKVAQILASRGEQVLLDRIVRVFPNHFDFLDGDRSFRRLHSLMDIFVDHKSGLSALTKKSAITLAVKDSRSADSGIAHNQKSRRLLEKSDDGEAEVSLEKGKTGSATDIAGHIDGKRVVPEPYNYRAAHRAPIVQMGYFGFLKNLNTFFSGNFIGGNFIKKGDFFNEWARVKNDIDVPFITVCALNENWGLLSTMFPNRTAAWGQCCDPAKEKLLYQFLNHDKTLLLITNQHNNISHPKLLTIPRGIPLTWQHTAKLMWDTQREVLHRVKKTKLLFAASSNWGARGQMIRCISRKFLPGDFEGHSDAPTISKKVSQIKLDRRHYYEKLGGTIFGLALPGLGYDCFRTWELLTMGTIVVLERGVGLDRTLWRLPALLLDDFNDVTPDLLRSAYVEAVYRADEFEFQRLTQSFWYSVITNVSASMSTQPLLDKFPMRAEDENFCRPRVPYECGRTGTCGPGTKRIPAESC